MKVIIAGSRGISNYIELVKAIGESGFEITEVISGAARGVDKLGELYAQFNKLKMTRFPADWSKGKSAGYVRNTEMAKYADALILLWDGKSKGSKHMKDIAEKQGLKVFVRIVNG